MKRITMVAVAVFAISAATAAAQSVDLNVTVVGEMVTGAPDGHLVTFSAPVNLPDATLSAGTYLFRFLTDSVVQVSSPDGRAHYAMFFTAPVTRPEATDECQIAVKARGILSPPKMTRMFLPNRTVGFEPLYGPYVGRGDR